MSYQRIPIASPASVATKGSSVGGSKVVASSTTASTITPPVVVIAAATTAPIASHFRKAGINLLLCFIENGNQVTSLLSI
jgi:hypothetical protein